VAALVAVPAAAPAAGPTLHVTTFAHTDLPLGQVYWTGREFLYASENLGTLETSDAAGTVFRPFAAFDQGGEEMRCAVPPNRYWLEGIYCHTPDNRIVRFGSDGSGPTLLARVPASGNSDGALAFDDVGRYGYALLVATGGSASDGGQVFAIRKDGRVQPIASYPGPGGAENLAIPPSTFGAIAGACLLSIDQDSVSGRLLAIDRKGKVTTVADGLGNGVNPLVVIKASPKVRPTGSPAAGLYLADTTSKQIWFAPASQFSGFTRGAVLVCTEVGAQPQCWIVLPSLSVVTAPNDLPQRAWNLEGSAYVS
jgi:hypothetical protein